MSDLYIRTDDGDIINTDSDSILYGVKAREETPQIIRKTLDMGRKLLEEGKALTGPMRRAIFEQAKSEVISDSESETHR